MSDDRYRLKLITCKVDEKVLEGLHELVRLKRFPSRSEAIREAIRRILKEEKWDEGGTDPK